MKVVSGRDLCLNTEYSNKLVGPMFYSWYSMGHMSRKRILKYILKYKILLIYRKHIWIIHLGFESDPEHVKKLPVTWSRAVVFAGYIGFPQHFQLAMHDLATIWKKE